MGSSAGKEGAGFSAYLALAQSYVSDKRASDIRGADGDGGGKACRLVPVGNKPVTWDYLGLLC